MLVLRRTCVGRPHRDRGPSWLSAYLRDVRCRSRPHHRGQAEMKTKAGMAGQTEVATAALQELRRAQPNISLAWIAEQMPIKLDADREHYLEGFRRAGLD